MGKMTKAQRTFLEKFEGDPIVYARGSNIRVANALDDLGLISVASVRSFCGYRITPAGRAAISSQREGE